MKFVKSYFVLVLVILLCFGCKQNQNKKKTTRPASSKEKISTPKAAKTYRVDFYESQVSPYSIEDTKQSKGRALGKNRSDYSEAEFKALPFYKRETYSVVVPVKISKESLRNTLKSIVDKKITADPDIDEIVILAYFKKNRIGKNDFTAGKLIWGPQGKLNHVKPKIAKNNIRMFYYCTIIINHKVGNIVEKDIPTDREWAIYNMVMTDKNFHLDDKKLDKKVMKHFNITSKKELYRIFYKVQGYKTF